MRLNVLQWPVLRLVQDSKTPLGIKDRNVSTLSDVTPGQRGGIGVETVTQTIKAHQDNISRTKDANEAQRSAVACFTAGSRQQNVS